MSEKREIRAVAAGLSCMDVYEKTGKHYPTGNGVDQGVHLRRMGVSVSVINVTGDDEYGKTMREMLTREQIEIPHLHEAHGDTCQMKMDLIDGVDRMHLEEVEGVMASFSLTKEDKEYIKTFDYLHTDLSGDVLGDLKELHEAGVKVVMDFPVSSGDEEYNTDGNYRHMDYVFLFYGQDDEYIREHIKRIQSFKPAIVTATLGDKGNINYDGNRYYCHGIVPVSVANTVGARDSYIAGFTYGIMQDWVTLARQELGAKISAQVIAKFEPYQREGERDMIIDMYIRPIFYDAICEDEQGLEFRKEAFDVFKQPPYGYEEMFAETDYAKVDRAALLPLDLTTTEGDCIVTNEQVARLVKDYLDRFIGLASVDPRRTDALEALDCAFGTLGLQELKLNPAKQRFYPNEEPLYPIYEKCLEYSKPIIFHAGFSQEPNAITEYAHPLELETVVVRYPALRMCLAHFAWPFVREMVTLMIKYPNVYTDTSVLYLDSPEESVKCLFTVDTGPLWTDRASYRQIMSASNGPRFRQFKILRALEKVEMRSYTREGIYYKNALYLLGEEEGE